MAFETFDLGKVIQTAETIKAMRDESTTRKLQQQYMANAENRAQAQFDMQAQKFGNEQTQFSQEQQLKNTKFANAYFKLMADDPSTASYAVEQMKKLNIIDPNFDVSTLKPEDIQNLSAQQYKQTSAILQSLNPQSPIAVSQGTVLLDPSTKQPIFSNPKPQEIKPPTLVEIKEGGNINTYEQYPDGSRRLIAKSPKWQEAPATGKPEQKANNAQTVYGIINEMASLIKNNPRSTATMLKPLAKGVEGVKAIFDPETEQGPAMAIDRLRETLISQADQMVMDGKMSNQDRQRLEEATGIKTLTSPTNALNALNVIIDIFERNTGVPFQLPQKPNDGWSIEEVKPEGRW